MFGVFYIQLSKSNYGQTSVRLRNPVCYRQSSHRFVIIIVGKCTALTIVQLSRPIFDAALSWAMKADRSLYWNGPAPRSSRLESDKGTVRTSGMSTPSKRNLTLSEEYVASPPVFSQANHRSTEMLCRWVNYGNWEWRPRMTISWLLYAITS